jgi:glycosyltransferase involved in cell wall biosynthesis
LRAAKKADAVIVMSPEMKAESGREDSYVIPFGANLAEFELLNKETARHRLNLPNGKKYILFPWNPSRKVKRFDLIEEACQILQRRLPDVELVVIHDLPQSEVVLYMNACDVLVLASDHEGSPVAVREAMACNLPVVSTDVGDVREVLAGVSQAVIVEQSPVAIAEGLYRVLSDSARSDGRAKMEQYDMMTASYQVLDVYHSVVESRRRSDD